MLSDRRALGYLCLLGGNGGELSVGVGVAIRTSGNLCIICMVVECVKLVFVG